MKRLIAALTVAALTLSFAACHSSEEEETTPDTQGITASTQAPTESQKENEVMENAFKEIVLVDNDDVAVKITGIEENAAPDFRLMVSLENKTEKELMFTADSVSINGFMCDPRWTETVAAGTTSSTDISWLADDLKDSSITTVNDISFSLRIYEDNGVLANEIFSDTFIYHLHG